MTQQDEWVDKAQGAALVAGGGLAGAGVSTLVGGMGLVGGFGGVAIGTLPVVVAGAMVGSATYGAKKALEEGDAHAAGAIAGGAVAGMGVSALIGGMGLAVGGAAVAIGAAPVVAAGALVGLAGYGLQKWGTQENQPLDQKSASDGVTPLDPNSEEAKLAQLVKEQLDRDARWASRDQRMERKKSSRQIQSRRNQDMTWLD